jgi:hypothetical protein
MKKWIPYVIAAVLGIGVAVLAFGPGLGGAPAEKKAPAKKSEVGKNFGDNGSAVIRPAGDDRLPSDVVADAEAHPIPPPGTLRPQNQAEIEHSARLARPFNMHFTHTASFWNRAAQIVGQHDADLGSQCGTMSKYLRDQSKLNDDELDAPAVIAREQALETKIRAAVKGDGELDGVLDYIHASGQAVLDGKDPTEVPKPARPEAGAQ